jgi:hypothetical protein
MVIEETVELVRATYAAQESHQSGLVPQPTVWENNQAGATRAHEVRTLQRTYFMTDVAEVTTRHT